MTILRTLKCFVVSGIPSITGVKESENTAKLPRLFLMLFVTLKIFKRENVLRKILF